MNPQQQYILARDMLDMLRKYNNNIEIIKYIDRFSFALARLLEDNSIVDWDGISALCDYSGYVGDREEFHGVNTEHLNDMLHKYQKEIDKFYENK